MSNDFELLGRLLLAAVLGGAIGAERELNDQAAGLRTHMLLTIGACLFTLISDYGFGGGIGTDPSRLAAKFVGERFALYRILPPAQEAPAIQESPSAGAGPQVVRVGPAIRQGAATPTRQRRVN